MKNPKNDVAGRSGAEEQPIFDPGIGPAVGHSDSLRRGVLDTLAAATASMEDFRIEGPKESVVRMRTLVHRGTQRPVHRLHSIRLGRSVECESALEYEAALLLDVSAEVQTFAEQPARLHYLHKGEWHSHVPDVLVVTDQLRAFWEIKFFKDISEDVRIRTALMTDRLSRLGVHYRLITEQDIRRGHAVVNARQILKRALHAPCKAQSLITLNQLRRVSGLPLSAFDWQVPRGTRAPIISRLILEGHAAVDPQPPLSPDSRVRAADVSGLKEVTSWLP